MALLTLLASSCTNDDIIIEKTGKKHAVTYNVSTQQMYKDFSIDDDVLKFLRDKDLSIGVYSYVYDETGKKVADAFSHQDNFNTITESFVLTEGKYTIISVETAVDPEENYTTARWSIEDIDKISSLKIKREYTDIRYPYVLGVSTNYVDVSESDVTVSAVPKPIGSLLQLYFYNFNESEYPQVAFGSQDVIEYYKIDPDLPRDDRFVTDLTSSDKTNIIGSVDSDEQKKSITRYVLDRSFEWTFFVKLQKDIDNNLWTFYDNCSGSANLEDGKTYYGAMYYINDNYLPQVYFGTSTGLNSWIKDMDQFKEDASDPVPNIFMSWGSSVTTTQNGMKNYNMIAGQNGHAAYDDASGIYYLMYQGVGPVQNIMYYFMNDTSGLYEVDLTYAKSQSNFNMIVNYLSDGFEFVEEVSETLIVFISNDKKTVAGLIEGDDYYALCFMDASVYYGENSTSKVYPNISACQSSVPIKCMPSKNMNSKTMKGRPDLYIPGMDYIFNSK